MRALLVGNVGDGDPGLVGARFEHHGYAFERVDRDHPETWPALDGAELIVLLGSEWSVYWPDIVEAVEAEAAACSYFKAFSTTMPSLLPMLSRILR